ncbi:hypothetical protein HMPREF0970_00600 [Schaalia odontolytica F0309]|uniref:Uncharacterized protein n=1 Tax=Schaalia odontolytica F0309 TaxID=649742 RepID=D4TWY4_9ACTO|nr:hypothetical protein HMPREF0970_00600 [Schaalia odontolytica F0309]
MLGVLPCPSSLVNHHESVLMMLSSWSFRSWAFWSLTITDTERTRP